jgi:hypothetical protein
VKVFGIVALLVVVMLLAGGGGGHGPGRHTGLVEHPSAPGVAHVPQPR